MKKIKSIILISMLLLVGLVKSQTNKDVDNHIALVEYWNTVNPTKEEKFSKFVEANRVEQNFTTWKKDNKFQYIKEMWYYAESFYIMRNYFAKNSVSIDGGLNTEKIDDGMIDISRFESNRKQTEEAIVVLPGFVDVIVLLPVNKLIYKP